MYNLDGISRERGLGGGGGFDIFRICFECVQDYARQINT